MLRAGTPALRLPGALEMGFARKLLKQAKAQGEESGGVDGIAFGGGVLGEPDGLGFFEQSQFAPSQQEYPFADAQKHHRGDEQEKGTSNNSIELIIESGDPIGMSLLFGIANGGFITRCFSQLHDLIQSGLFLSKRLGVGAETDTRV